MNRKPVFGRLLAAILMIAILLVPIESFAQRRSFGGGSRSFGGGGFGGSMRRSSGGSFGGSGGFGGIRSGGSNSATRSGGSFGRSSSSFGSPRTFTSTQSRGGSPFAPRAGSFGGSGFHSYGNSYYFNNYPVRYYGGGYGSYWFHPAWYYWMPFHPAFFYSPPVYVNGYYEPGGFSFMRLLIAMCIFIVIFWIIARLFSTR